MIQARATVAPPADDRAPGQGRHTTIPAASALVIDDESPALDELSYLLLSLIHISEPTRPY